MKKLVPLFLFIFFNIPLLAQEIEWQVSLGGINMDELHDFKRSSDNGFLISSASASGISGIKDSPNIGGYDFWFMKVDSVGNLLWQKSLGGTSADYGTITIETSDGGYMFGGYSSSDISADKTENSQGFYDYWIIKLDSNRVVEWQNTIGGNSADYLLDIYQTSDNGFLCAGSSSSGISGDKTENSVGENFWIVKTDSVGNVIWDKTYVIQTNDRRVKILPLQSGNFLIAGTYISDCVLFEIDSAGNLQWQKYIGGNMIDRLRSIVQTADDGFILALTSYSGISGDKTIPNKGYTDYWIVKLDSLANIQWQVGYGTNSYDDMHSIDQTPDGGYICIGTSEQGKNGDKTSDHWGLGHSDYWIIKLDSVGSIQWDRGIGGYYDENYSKIYALDNNDFVIGGYTSSSDNGDKTGINFGAPTIFFWDIWVFSMTDKINAITGSVYADFNQNGIQDAGDLGLKNRKVTEQNTNRFAFSNSVGKYDLNIKYDGNFLVNPPSILYHDSNPLSYNISFSGYNNTDSLKDFSFTPSVSVNDLCIDITALSGFRAGMNTTYHVKYTNEGSTTLNPTFIFYPDPLLSFVSATMSPVSINQDSIVFSLNPIQPFFSSDFYITFTVDLSANVGNVISSNAIILPVIGDQNPACNEQNHSGVVTGSFDPNDITVDRSELYDYEIWNPEWLYYTIRFQNTGNDTAFFARIDNKIRNELDVQTIEIITTSHPCDIHYQDYSSTLHFTFNNILLPDSNVNEPLSHGLIKYRIKPKNTLQVGDTIKNAVAIIFDYNQPISTDTAITKIVLPTSISGGNLNPFEIELYPNPTDKTLHIKTNSSSIGNVIIEIFNIYGQLSYSNSNYTVLSGSNMITLDVSGLASGLYFVRLSGDSNVIKRFIKSN